MKKLFMLAVLLASVLLLSFSAVSTGAQGTQDVTITMWTHDGLYVQFFNARAEEWKENYPDINFTFDFQVVPQVFDVVLANLAAGEPIPDLLGIEQGQFPRFMQNGIIEQKFVDLLPLIGDEYERVVEGRWTPYTYEGGVYGVDSSLAAAVYYYQPAIFEQYGVDVPTTWGEFLETGAVLGESGVSMAIITTDAGGFMMYLLQRGGLVFDEEGEFVLPEPENRQAAIDVLNLFREGIDSGAFNVVIGGEFWGPSPIAAYREGRVAGAIMPDWYSDYIIKPQADDMAGLWRVAPMPVWDDGQGHKTSVWGGTGFAISQDSQHVDLVWDLLHYAYLTDEGQLLRNEEINYYPTIAELFTHPRVVELEDPYYGGQKLGEVYAQLVDDVPIWYQSVFREAFNEAVTTELVLFYEGAITAEETVDNIILFVEDEIAFSR